MRVDSYDLYLNPTEAEVARSMDFEFEATSAGGFYRLLHCGSLEERDILVRQIMQAVNDAVESEWRQKWNIEEAER